MFPRTPSTAVALGRRLDHTIDARQFPRLNLELRDVSVGGLTALSDRPLGQGEHLSVTVTPPDGHSGWGAFGRVIRCEPSTMGFRIAVQFDPLPAA